MQAWYGTTYALPGVYLHIPFCEAKCHYCAFDSRPVAGEDVDAYCDALVRQIRRMAAHPWCRQRRFSTLYVGGGTPTVLGRERLCRVLEAALHCFAFAKPVEVSVEANPNTVAADLLAHLRQAGVNRLSIGVQSLDDRLLVRLGRRHTAAQGVAAVEAARRAGFANVSVDLIYGLPGQTARDWRQTLAAVLALDVEHLSLYELSVDPGSRFHQRPPALPPEDEVVAMNEITAELTAAAGMERYEISNYCRPGFACRHNLNYWQNGDYLGLGAGAVSCFGGLRLRAVGDPALFVRRLRAGEPVWSEGEALSLAARFRETVVMGLRCTAGLDLRWLRQRFGIDIHAFYGGALARLIEAGYLVADRERLCLAGHVVPVANRVLAELV